MSEAKTLTLTSARVDNRIVDVVATVEDYIARASKSRDDKVRARATSFESAVNFLIVDAAEENIRKFDKAQADKIERKETKSKADAYDSFLQLFSACKTEEERLALVDKLVNK